MATLTIRNLPDEVHSALKERAKLNRRSLNQEVIAELEGGSPVEGSQVRMERVMRETDEIRSRAKAFLTSEEIDAARKEGRA